MAKCLGCKEIVKVDCDKEPCPIMLPDTCVKTTKAYPNLQVQLGNLYDSVLTKINTLFGGIKTACDKPIWVDVTVFASHYSQGNLQTDYLDADNLGYSKDCTGTVYMRGVLFGESGYDNTVAAFTLPALYRPKKTKYFFFRRHSFLVNNSLYNIKIMPTGEVFVAGLSTNNDPTAFWFFDGLLFETN